MSRTYFHLGFALTLFVIALVCYGFWYHALGTMGADVSELTSEVSAKNLSAAQALVAEDQLAKLSAEEGAIHGYFVAPEGVVPFLEGLQSIGTSAGAKVNVVSVSANPLPRPHLDLALKVSGSFDAVLRTVGAIEYSPHDITVTTLTLDTDEGEGAAGWTAAMALSVGTASSSPSVPKSNTSAASSTATTTP